MLAKRVSDVFGRPWFDDDPFKGIGTEFQDI